MNHTMGIDSESLARRYAYSRNAPGVAINADNFQWHRINCELDELTLEETEFVEAHNLGNISYVGDLNLEYGGVFIAPQKHGYARAMEIVDCTNFDSDNEGNLIVTGEISLGVDNGGYWITNQWGYRDMRRKFTMKKVRDALESSGYRPYRIVDTGNGVTEYPVIPFRELGKKQFDMMIYYALFGSWGIDGAETDYLPTLDNRLKVNKTWNHRLRPRYARLERMARDMRAELITLKDNEIGLNGLVLARLESLDY